MKVCKRLLTMKNDNQTSLTTVTQTEYTTSLNDKIYVI